jgi:hypothetical protein
LKYFCDEGPVFEYIAENYGKHCISGIYPDLGELPLKILFRQWNLDVLDNQKYAPSLQYLEIRIPSSGTRGWDRYQDVFDQFTNLKAIELTYANKTLLDVLPEFPPEKQEIWKKRIVYFQKRGIRLAKRNEIEDNENLQIQLAKEAGISWRFHFI